MKTGKTLVLLIALSSLIACSNQKTNTTAESKTQHQPSAEHGAADLRQETTGVATLPSFLQKKPEEMQVLYQAVAQHKKLLEKIPCYCGCGDSVHHKNNYDCFVHENKQNGAIVWDDHGTKCGVCLEIAAQSIMDYKNGKSVKEIRKKIDTTYEKKQGKPTPTPSI
ncbi:Lipoprotein, putative [Fictibacillus macauensis ZFHKF-1]|uniref:Lipoprotein, putative n=1 Tax=Fictibacillus macauensis ZFHKF-1 TaxID=1196324 RepID=I8UH88_9BACL|nr:PCYCGC motif-containing (lipo)protein [Fictibacillus macauensis]EIT86183.1 Lipoprotein, putative [Fictibacillus macauensis ZFHKF-1]